MVYSKENIIKSPYIRKNCKDVNNEIFKLLKPYMKKHSKQIYVDLIQTMYYIFFETLPEIIEDGFSYRRLHTPGLNYRRTDHCQAFIIYKILDICKYFDIIMIYLSSLIYGTRISINDLMNYKDNQLFGYNNIDNFLQRNHIHKHDFLTALIIYIIYNAYIDSYVKYALNIGLVNKLQNVLQDGGDAILNIEAEQIVLNDRYGRQTKIISFNDIDKIITDTEKQEIIDTLKPLINKIEALINSIKLHPNNFNLFRSTVDHTFNVHQDTYRPLSPMKESSVSPLEWSPPPFKGGKPMRTRTTKTTKTAKTAKTTKATKATKAIKAIKATKATKAIKAVKPLRRIPKRDNIKNK